MSRTHRHSLIHSFLHVCPFPRVVYVFGSHMKEPPSDITPTFLTTGVLSTLRQADFVAHSILRESGKCVYPSVLKRCRLLGWLNNQYSVIVCILAST